MPTGIEEVIVVVGGVATWLNSLPATFKYLIFLSAFFVDVTIAEITGFGNGFIVMPINVIIQQGFGFPLIELTSFQLLIVFIMLPIIFYCLKN